MSVCQPLPSTVTVTFPTCNGSTTSVSTCSPLPGGSSLGTKVIHDTLLVTDSHAHADALAQAIACDYLSYQAVSHDVVFNGILPWAPEGISDCLEFSYDTESVSSRIMTGVVNAYPEEMMHGDGSRCGSSSSGSSVSPISPSSSSSNAQNTKITDVTCENGRLKVYGVPVVYEAQGNGKIIKSVGTPAIVADAGCCDCASSSSSSGQSSSSLSESQSQSMSPSQSPSQSMSQSQSQSQSLSLSGSSSSSSSSSSTSGSSSSSSASQSSSSSSSGCNCLGMSSEFFGLSWNNLSADCAACPGVFESSGVTMTRIAPGFWQTPFSTNEVEGTLDATGDPIVLKLCNSTFTFCPECTLIFTGFSACKSFSCCEGGDFTVHANSACTGQFVVQVFSIGACD